ncbi:Ketoacyl-ACP synthase III [Candidatus Magnetomoraceae bacterium gMMP-15]
MISAGLISMGAYLPAKQVPEKIQNKLSACLKNETLLYPEYIDPIKNYGQLPGKIETNYDGWESQPWFESWLKKLPPQKRKDPFQGTKERRRVPLDPVSIKKSVIPHPMLSSDAETFAGALAIFNGGIDKDEIDLIIVNSLVPDRHVPLNASLVQHKLGLKNAGAYNVDTCCSSFITMLEIAVGLIKTGIKKKILIVASAMDSHINDKSTYYNVDTGDAAVAGVVSQVEDDFGYIASCSSSNGSRHAAITFHKRRPELLITTTQGPNYEQEFVTFYDQTLCQEIAKNAKKDMINTCGNVFKKAGITVSDIDFFVTHQPVAWTANAWREAVGVPPEKFYESFEKYGNIACCSSPVNFLEAIEKRMIIEGHKVLIASSGVGENHIALLEKISPQLIRSIQI